MHMFGIIFPSDSFVVLCPHLTFLVRKYQPKFSLIVLLPLPGDFVPFSHSQFLLILPD